MMKEEPQKTMSLVDKMKQNLKKQKREVFQVTEPGLQALTCPNCGAGRAKDDGVTRCAYCNFEFIPHQITDGIHLKKTDNSPD